MIKDIAELRVGDDVYYQPSHYSRSNWLNGVVKTIKPECHDHVWVVFHCGSDWDHYWEYTAQMTKLSDLNLGWKF